MQAGFNKQKEIQRLIQEKKDAEIDAHLRRQLLVRNFFIFSFAVVLVFAFLAYRGLRRIRKDNKKLSAQQKEILEINEQMNQQKEEVMAQAEQIEMTNHELERKNDQLRMRNLQIKKSQQQLILQEKLATVGQLTTGIAHEIKNPLNFVNNFSNLTNELTRELRDILENSNGGFTGEKQEQVIELLEMIESNVEKINEHGKRADRIIKGMLQQSRDAREFELTDFNTLVSEYVNLAYHGERAKDQSFSLNLIKDLDSNVGNVNLVSHDFGRVILNLVGNACYALRQKQQLNGREFTPEIKIFSYTKKDNIHLKIRDNGIGIPKDVKTKIFNPFFTTKPSGEGTGLGLSTSYEIITKTHKGSIEVKSTEGVFTEFEIMVPRNL
jgi:signal transduction histidine kinase